MDTDEILIDNLKEAFKTSHNYLLWATWASLFLLALILKTQFIDVGVQTDGNPSLSQDKVDLVGIETNTSTAVILLTIAILALGYMAYISVSRIRRIQHRLRIKPEILKVAFLYPVIPTIHNDFSRRMAVILPALIFTICLLITYVPKLFDDDPSFHWLGVLFFILILNIPFLATVWSFMGFPFGS